MRPVRSVLTGSALSSRVGQWTQPGLIKSIQRGSIALAPAATSNTATITAVDPNNTRLMWLGNESTEDGSTSVASTGVRLVLTNSTTVTASRLASTGTATVGYEVIEYWPGVIRTVQRGTVTATAAASGTATLATTLQTITKATLDIMGWDYNTALLLDSLLGRVTLTNTTTITLTRANTSGNLTAGYQVTEWY